MNNWKPEIGEIVKLLKSEGLIIALHGDKAWCKDLNTPAYFSIGIDKLRPIKSQEDEAMDKAVSDMFDIINSIQTNKHRALEIAEEFYLKGFRKMGEEVSVEELSDYMVSHVLAVSLCTTMLKDFIITRKL